MSMPHIVTLPASARASSRVLAALLSNNRGNNGLPDEPSLSKAPP